MSDFIVTMKLMQQKVGKNALPSVRELWLSKMPDIGQDPDMPLPANLIYSCVASSLPMKYHNELYQIQWRPTFIDPWLRDAAYLPVLRVSAITGLLSRLVTEKQFPEADRNHIDGDKTTLLFEIIGKAKSIDSKTASGNAFNAATIKYLPNQMLRIVNDCHILAGKLLWDDGAVFEYADLAESKDLFEELVKLFSGPLTKNDFKDKLVQGALTTEQLQLSLYKWFLKLGIIERVLWTRTAHVKPAENSRAMEDQRTTQLASNWAVVPVEDPIPKTTEAIKGMCEALYLDTQGALDNTARAHVKAIPTRMIYGGDALQLMKSVVHGSLEDIASRLANFCVGGITSLFESSEMDRAEVDRLCREFIEQQGKIVDCWK